MNVLEAIQRSTEFLTRKGVESPRLQAELLLAHVLKLKRMQLYLNFERLLLEPQLSEYRELVRRRAERVPLQHLVGSVNFCGIELEVNRSVLIPRPETEILAEEGWTFLEQRGKEGGAAPTVLDMGTGSGCLAIALARQNPGATVVATDRSPEALEVARRNAVAHGLAERIVFVEGDLFTTVPGRRFDLVISNPPYIATGDIASLQPEVRDFDPRQALDGGSDGLDFFRRIAAEGLGHLAGGGKCMVEFGDGQGPEIEKIFEKQKWIVDAVRQDYTQRQRILIASRNDSRGPDSPTLNG